ncbi:hypothetical protein BDY19DRAFT_968587 [Irpex rosettiformis]|uniref:Uncharacterized protein n=1 Tax=Irpex rosettiformis TaxID=378272 RepID=A0ACB8TS48_9APHY|nr:hypothetical protein BDY19DRAFT_968587 [Irpex rosettiformis]
MGAQTDRTPSSHKDEDPQPVKFLEPFDDEDGDIIIRSCDNMHFRVHKLILKKASPVFDGMFMLPTGDDTDPVQTVPLEEGSITVARLLRLCYPFGSPQLGTLDDVSNLLNTCEKYQMHRLAEKLVSSELAKFVDTNPLRAYILACRANSLQEARRAAYRCLVLSLEDIIASAEPEIRHLSALAFKSLLLYYNQCRQAAATVLSSCRFGWTSTAYCWFNTYGHDLSCGDACQQRFWYGEGLRCTVYPRRWWYDMMSPAVTHLLHEAPPLSPRLAETIPFPKNLPCNYCRTSSGDDLHRFFGLLEQEIQTQVKAVEFRLVA